VVVGPDLFTTVTIRRSPETDLSPVHNGLRGERRYITYCSPHLSWSQAPPDRAYNGDCGFEQVTAAIET